MSLIVAVAQTAEVIMKMDTGRQTLTRDSESSQAMVLDFSAFKARKSLKGERGTGLTETFAPKGEFSDDSDFATRVERIKSSITRINSLMAELKAMSDKDQK